MPNKPPLTIPYVHTETVCMIIHVHTEVQIISQGQAGSGYRLCFQFCFKESALRPDHGALVLFNFAYEPYQVTIMWLSIYLAAAAKNGLDVTQVAKKCYITYSTCINYE